MFMQGSLKHNSVKDSYKYDQINMPACNCKTLHEISSVINQSLVKEIALSGNISRSSAPDWDAVETPVLCGTSFGEHTEETVVRFLEKSSNKTIQKPATIEISRLHC